MLCTSCTVNLHLVMHNLHEIVTGSKKFELSNKHGKIFNFHTLNLYFVSGGSSSDLCMALLLHLPLPENATYLRIISCLRSRPRIWEHFMEVGLSLYGITFVPTVGAHPPQIVSTALLLLLLFTSHGPLFSYPIVVIFSNR